MTDGTGTPDGISITCPDERSGDETTAKIRDRGNLPLLISDNLLAELSEHEMLEGWHELNRLNLAELSAIYRQAATNLTQAFDAGLETADLNSLVADAAVVFLLSLKQYGLSNPRDIRPCTVVPTGELRTAEVQAAA